MSGNAFIKTVDQFSATSQSLKNYFHKQFSNPLHASEERFQWDYWHVPGQYTAVRTPAYHFFPEELFEQLKTELEDWGLKNLGCGEISPSWLSYYVEGCEQLFHADNPHGPWAFVYSLTDWENRTFTGGETKLLSENVLNYWHDFDSSKGFEENTLLTRVEPLFNRLTVFDPRVPHGVETVKGEKDPRKARVVIHGWFLPPNPMVNGGLEDTDIESVLGSSINPVLDEVESSSAFNGYVCLRLRVETDGSVQLVETVANTLRSISPGALSPDDVAKNLVAGLKTAKFPTAKSSSEITLPLVFE